MRRFCFVKSTHPLDSEILYGNENSTFTSDLSLNGQCKVYFITWPVQRQISLSVSCRKDSSVIGKESHREGLPYGLWLIHRWYYGTIQHLLFTNAGQMYS